MNSVKSLWRHFFCTVHFRICRQTSGYLGWFIRWRWWTGRSSTRPSSSRSRGQPNYTIPRAQSEYVNPQLVSDPSLTKGRSNYDLEWGDWLAASQHGEHVPAFEEVWPRPRPWRGVLRRRHHRRPLVRPSLVVPCRTEKGSGTNEICLHQQLTQTHICTPILSLILLIKIITGRRSSIQGQYLVPGRGKRTWDRSSWLSTSPGRREWSRRCRDG
jgi:hypothetical protein